MIVFVNENSDHSIPGDLDIYGDMPEMLKHLEPMDVANGEYCAILANGCPVLLTVTGTAISGRVGEPSRETIETLGLWMRTLRLRLKSEKQRQSLDFKLLSEAEQVFGVAVAKMGNLVPRDRAPPEPSSE